jgi:hypothetical protein
MEASEGFEERDHENENSFDAAFKDAENDLGSEIEHVRNEATAEALPAISKVI